MSWLEAIRDLLASDDLEERVSSVSRPGVSEVLEYRLVLGSLSSDLSSVIPRQGVQPDTNGTAITPLSQSTTPADDVENSSNTVSTAAAMGPDDSAEQTSSEDSSANQTSDLTSGDLQLTSGQQLSALADDSKPVPTTLESITVADGGGSTGAQDVPPTTPSTDLRSDGNVLSTTSVPVTPTDIPSPSSPPVAIDKALTAVNPDVMVSNEELAAAGFGSSPVVRPAWFADQASTVIHYDFRDTNGVANTITDAQIQFAEQVLQAWSDASDGKIKFERDMTSDSKDIVNIGVGNLSALGMTGGTGGVLGTSSHALMTVDGSQTSVGTIWLDCSKTWSSATNGTVPAGTVDFSTVMAHEVGHVLGLDDVSSTLGIMNPNYTGPQDLSGIGTAFQNPKFFLASAQDADGYIHDNMTTGQLSIADVATLLDRASVATPSNDAIIAIVDRNGTILGVRAEQDVLNTITDPSTLAFAIDGAISKARSAALFANDTAPITSRTLQTISQSTILQREVESNPNSTDPTIDGPGFVAPIGLGGHFPNDVQHTPPVDLFNIEASNRGSTTNPGREAFNIDPANVALGVDLNALVTYGTASGNPEMASDVQNRGIATLPGGLPIYLDGKIVGAIGVFFPGRDGYATYEQGFEHGIGQTTIQRVNAPKVLEAEYIAYAALGGSVQAGAYGVMNSVIGTIGGIAPVAGTGLPFGFITLSGVSLPLFGSTPGTKGLQDLVNRFAAVSGTGANSGSNQPLLGTAPESTTLDGTPVSTGYLVVPHTSVASGLTVADMTKIIDAGVAASDRVRAAIRLDGNTLNTGAVGVRMTFAITDTTGEVLALYRMDDGTIFSTDVAIAKARNVAYFDSPNLQPQDQVKTSVNGPVIPVKTAFTNRTFRFLAEPRFPSGVDGSPPPQFSILNDAIAAGIDPTTGENKTPGSPAAASAFTTVMGHDVFNPGTNFHDPTDTDNQNGVVFFPGSMPLYKNGVLVGGLGVSGDGVNQDDLVTFLAAQGFQPDGVTIKTADETTVNDVRLPFQNFGRNPFA